MRGLSSLEGILCKSGRRLGRQVGECGQRESGLVMANACRLVIPVYMRAGRPPHQENVPCTTTLPNIPENQGSYSPRPQIARLVLRIGVTCTVHRRHLYPASPQLVLRMAFRVADAKNSH